MTLSEIKDTNYHTELLNSLNASNEDDRELAFHSIIALQKISKSMEFTNSPDFQLVRINNSIEAFNKKFGWSK